ncbi:MAG: hypothetical protein KatS3mg060_1448 [Dehalococcoidia bacterium]|nr:MAG: hypothetical protein KatS3mg060_1448 [Dehalococcoidia bacterium]
MTVTDVVSVGILGFVLLVLAAIVIPEFLRRPSMKP